MQRIDDAPEPPDAEVRGERRVVEEGVAPLGVVALEGEVAVAEEALRHHQVVGLVALRAHPDVAPAGGHDEHGEREGKEEGPRQPDAAGRDGQRQAREGERQEGRAGEGPHARDRQADQHQGDRRQEARRGREAVAARREHEPGGQGDDGHRRRERGNAEPHPARAKGGPARPEEGRQGDGEAPQGRDGGGSGRHPGRGDSDMGRPRKSIGSRGTNLARTRDGAHTGGGRGGQHGSREPDDREPALGRGRRRAGGRGAAEGRRTGLGRRRRADGRPPS